jgi:hypothetical protein
MVTSLSGRRIKNKQELTTRDKIAHKGKAGRDALGNKVIQCHVFDRDEYNSGIDSESQSPERRKRYELGAPIL